MPKNNLHSDPEVAERWSEISKTAPKTMDRDGCISIPTDAVVFIITGRCMEPAFPHGSGVFAVKPTLPFILIGTPVVVDTTSGHRLCKMWNGESGDAIFLRSMNSGPDIHEHIVLSRSEIAGLWIVLGCLFRGRPLTRRYPEPAKSDNIKATAAKAKKTKATA